MVGSDENPRPSVHLGDYPDGMYWSAEVLPGGEEGGPSDYSVSGPVIRMMWDYGVGVPLWDAEGLLPEEPHWLRTALGLRDSLIEDLLRWGLDMEELDGSRSLRTKTAYAALHLRAQDLVRRLQHEVDFRYTIQYHPWR